MKYKPHDYQNYTTERMLDTKKIIAILDMGLGKTVCTLTAINELMFDRFECSKVLVIAPLRVARKTWTDEIEKFDHLRHLKASKILGTEAERIRGLKADADIYLINRENVVWLVEYCIKQKKWPFDTLIIDESSSFKSNQSKRFKALRKVAAITDRVIELTGTPSPNGLMDLWSQIYLLDQGERLGKTITSYRDRYFKPGRRNRTVVYEYVPKKGAEEAIYKAIGDIAISLKAADYLKLPDRIDNVIKLQLPTIAREQYDELERECILELDSQAVVTAGSQAVVTNKLLQMANGAVYSETKSATTIHDVKLDALEEIIEENQGKPIMVFYNYQHDYSRLMARLSKYNPRTLDTDDDQDDWNAGKIQVLLAHPASMGHGLNLQAGGNIIVWFGLTWSLELYQQANARLYRQGQQQAVIIHHLVAEDTVDEDVLRALKAKSVNQDDLIAAVKARIEAHSRA